MKLSVCPFSVAVFAGTAAYMTLDQRRRKKGGGDGGVDDDDDAKLVAALPPCKVVFVLGGPGSGKGTQCELLEKRLDGGNGWAHLSTGDLLRAERKKGGALGNQINAIIESGKLVPSEITVQLLEKGMAASYRATSKTKFLIDGFPRSFGNADAWQKLMSPKGHAVEFVLNLHCPEDVMTARLLERGKTSGRTDDSVEVIQKRFCTNAEECAPVIAHYQKQGTIRTVNADQPVEAVYEQIESLFR